MDNGFRYPGEFEPQTDVFVEWVPFAEPIKGYDAWAPITEIVRNLMEEVTVYINCCPTVDGLLADCKKTLVDAGIDIEQIKFTQFDEDPTSSISAITVPTSW